MADPVADGSERWQVLYDADCGFCKWLLSGLLVWDRRWTLQPVALQEIDAERLLRELSPEERMASWHLVSPTGERHSAGAALAPMLRLLPGGALPAAGVDRIPRLTESGYRWVAAHRSVLSRGVPGAAKRSASGMVQRRERALRDANEADHRFRSADRGTDAR